MRALLAASGLAAVPIAARANAAFTQTDRPLDLRFRTLEGDDVRLADLHGYGVWLNFFTTWCPGCCSETPAIVDMARANFARGLRVVGVSVDERDEVVRSFRSRFGIGYPLAIDPRGHVFGSLNLEDLPYSIFLDRAGVARSARAGELSRPAMQTLIDAIVA